MIGNDVIDLALARKESNWKRKGFLQKLFTEWEQEVIHNAQNPEVTLWNLWSRKEAAYKIYNRETGIRSFMPLKLQCEFESESKGKVICADRLYYTRTNICNDCIETIAVIDSKSFSEINYLINRIGIQKTSSVPHYNQRPVSLSNHGRFESIVTL